MVGDGTDSTGPGLAGARAGGRGRRWGRAAEAESRRAQIASRAETESAAAGAVTRRGARGPVGPPRGVCLRARVRAARGRGGRCRGREARDGRPRPLDRGVSTEEARRCLARHVYRHTQELAGETPGAAQLPPVMVWVSRLARLQRASLALCVFGGLTHREAAALLDVPPSTVADLLTAGLRELGASLPAQPRPAPDGDASVERAGRRSEPPPCAGPTRAQPCSMRSRPLAVLALATDFALPVTASYMAGPPGTTPQDPAVLFDIPTGLAVAGFLALSALAHLLVCTAWWQRYVADLGRQRNPARWVEYSLSSSLMIVLIAQLVGISDVAALVALFGVNAAMILFGWLQERYERPGSGGWLPFGFGCVAGVVPWVAITVYLLSPGSTSSASPPGFVYGIFVSLFVFFNVFALNQWLQYRAKGRWRDYLFGEKVYIVLSLTAKSALAWQIFAGTLAA